MCIAVFGKKKSGGKDEMDDNRPLATYSVNFNTGCVLINTISSVTILRFLRFLRFLHFYDFLDFSIVFYFHDFFYEFKWKNVEICIVY